MKCTRCRNDSGKYKLCSVCRAKQREANNRFFGRVPPVDHKCATSVCVGIATGRSVFCPFCVRMRELAQKRKYNRDTRAAAKGKPIPETPTVTTLKDAITEAGTMRDRRDRLNPDLLNQRLFHGAFR
jgi:hypothetical protein